MSEIHTPSCAVHDVAIFIGLASSPIGHEQRLHTDVLEKLFRRYKKAVRDNFSAHSPSRTTYEVFDEILYKPRTFFTFGRFDLAEVALIDDLEFGIRTFGPYDPMTIDSDVNGRTLPLFSHQTIMGPIPRFGENPSVLDLAKKTVLADTDPLPLFGICQLKLNWGALLGSGMDLLHGVVVAIRGAFESHRQKNGRPFQLFIAESYSWHEITLLMTGVAYRDMIEFVVRLREMTGSDLRDLINLFIAGPRTNMTPKIVDSLRTRVENALQNSLVNELTATRQDWPEDHREHNPVFEASTTTLGFQLELFSAIAEKEEEICDRYLELIPEDDVVVPHCRWFTQAGHIAHSLDSLKGFINSDDLLFCAGKGDFVLPDPTRTPTRDFIPYFVKLRLNLRDNRHVRASYSTIAVPRERPKVLSDERYHIDLHQDVIRPLLVTHTEVAEFDRLLKEMGTAKPVSERLENLLANYNDGLGDPLLFGFFLELRQLILWLMEQPAIARGQSTTEGFMRYLTGVADAFDRAYRNRFYTGYRMNEITDFNLEFKGGIQQLVSAYDGAFKTLARAFIHSQGFSHVFVVVGGSPGVSTTSYCFNLNYLHLQQPEYFAAVVGYELGRFRLATETTTQPAGLSSDLELFKLKACFDGFAGTDGPEDPIVSALVPLVQPELLEYLYRDLTAFYLTFSGDSDLFSFWYFVHWYTLASAHKQGSEISPGSFLTMLLRVVLVLRVCGAEFSGIRALEKEPTFGPLITGQLESVKDFVIRFLDFQPIGEWAQKAAEEARSVLFSAAKTTNLQESLDQTNGLAAKYTERLSAGGLVLFSDPEIRQSVVSATNHTRVLLFAYLRWMKNLGGSGHRFMIRDKETGLPQVTPDLSPVVFDGRGGTFCCDPEIRRRYFQCRTSLILSLLDMSAVEKKRQVLNALSQAEVRETHSETSTATPEKAGQTVPTSSGDTGNSS